MMVKVVLMLMVMRVSDQNERISEDIRRILRMLRMLRMEPGVQIAGFREGSGRAPGPDRGGQVAGFREGSGRAPGPDPGEPGGLGSITRALSKRIRTLLDPQATLVREKQSKNNLWSYWSDSLLVSY